MSFKLTSSVCFNFWTAFEFLGILCNYVGKNGIIYIPQFQGNQLIIVCTYWPKNLWRCSTIGVFPSSGSCKHFPYFLNEFEWSKRSSLGAKHDIFMCTPSFKCYDLKMQMVFQTPLTPLQLACLLCLKTLWIYPTSTSKQPFYNLGKIFFTTRHKKIFVLNNILSKEAWMYS